MNMADIFLEMGETRKAIELYENAKERLPYWGEIHFRYFKMLQ